MSKIELPADASDPETVHAPHATSQRVRIETFDEPIRYGTSASSLRTSGGGTRVPAFRDTTVTVPAGEALYGVSDSDDDNDALIRAQTGVPESNDTQAVVQQAERPADRGAREGRQGAAIELIGVSATAEGNLTINFGGSPSGGDYPLYVEAIVVKWDPLDGTSGQVAGSINDPDGPAGGSLMATFGDDSMPTTINFDPAVRVSSDNATVDMNIYNPRGSLHDCIAYAVYRATAPGGDYQ